jgi:hypothetical protein
VNSWDGKDNARVCKPNAALLVAATNNFGIRSAILDYLKGRDNLGIRLASFFTKTGAGYPLTAHAALASWLKQLCIQAPGSAIETQLVQLYEKNGGKKYSQENIGIDQLAELLGKFSSECQRCILVLDGFDELPASERRIFMDSVKKWTEDRLGFARILLASRPDHAITSTLESWPSITVNGSTNHGDIVRFINFELDSAIEDRRLLRGKVSQTTLQRIQTHLLDASDGM